MKSKDNNTVLMIMAHGSRKVEANQEFEQLTRDIAKQEHKYAEVKPCFLELAVPSLAVAVEKSIGQGYTQFDVYPLFFNKGNHVTSDIPRQISHLEEKYPQCTFHRLEYFGTYDQLGGQVLSHISQQQSK
jgi:sirohydrochlorin cobaltochelatase